MLAVERIERGLILPGSKELGINRATEQSYGLEAQKTESDHSDTVSFDSDPLLFQPRGTQEVLQRTGMQSSHVWIDSVRATKWFHPCLRASFSGPKP